MALLFGRNARGANQPKHLVEFRAGKMNLKGNMVHPDKRKGLVYIYQSDDGLTHFCWKDRTSGVVEDDLIIFPEDAEFLRVTQCKEEARVFLLKFKASSRKLFYWMQEPKADGDGEKVTKVNEAINNPGAAGSSRGGTSTSNTPSTSEQDMHNLLQSMSQSQLMQLLGGMHDLEGTSNLLQQFGLGSLTGGGSGSSSGNSVTSPTGNSSSAAATTTASAPAPAPASAKKEKSKPSSSSSASGSKTVQLQDLQKILSGMQQQPATVDLSTAVNTDLVTRITSSPTTVQKLVPLLPKFGFTATEPKANSDPKDLVDTLISPAFQHALSSFCSAFPSGQLGPLVEQFEFGKDAIEAAQAGNLEAFLNAVQKEADCKTEETTEKSEDMNVD